jgi:hypothetical protein
MKPKVLTQSELATIGSRSGDNTVSSAALARDVQALLVSHEALSEMLSDCWLTLDEIARNQIPAEIKGIVETLIVQRHTAQVLLRRQEAPGYCAPPGLPRQCSGPDA